MNPTAAAGRRRAAGRLLLRARGAEDRLRDQRRRRSRWCSSGRPSCRRPARRGRTPTSSSISPAGSASATQFWDGDIEAAYRHQLAPTGVTLEQLRARPGGVRVPLQTRHAKHAEPDANGDAARLRHAVAQGRALVGDLPRARLRAAAGLRRAADRPRSRPDLAARFPLVLTCAKPTLFCQTQHRALAEPAQARARIRRWSCIPTRPPTRGISRRRLGVRSRRRTGGMRARARLNDEPRSARGGRRARLVAGVCRARRAGL